MNFWIVIYGLLLVTLGCWVLIRWKALQLQYFAGRFLAGIFIIKAIASFALISLYTYYYTDKENADLYKYFDDGKVLQSAITESPADFLSMLSGINDNREQLQEKYYSKMNHWTRSGNLSSLLNDNKTMIRFNAVFHCISFSSVWIHGVLFAFISTIGFILLFKAFEPELHQLYTTLAILVFTPSILLWFSGPLKESILILGIGLLFYGILKKHSIWKQAILIILGLFFMLNAKMYILPPILLLIVSYKILPFFKKPIYGVLLFLLVGFGTSYFLDNTKLSPAKVLQTKQTDFINLAKGGFMLHQDSLLLVMPYESRDKFIFSASDSVIPKINFKVRRTDWKLNFIDSTSLQKKAYKIYFDQKPAESYFPIQPIDGTTKSLLIATPSALLNNFIRPLPTKNNPFTWLTSVENILFIILLIITIYRLSFAQKNANLIYSLLLGAFLILLIIGWTTPVAGALVRYKLPAIFLLIFAFGLTHKKKFIHE